MVFNQAKQGFTLIELLVVVLIIGILAAVALPQYQKAVDKSRYSNLMYLTNALAQANEIYYLANNTYATDFTQLDIDVPTTSVNGSTATFDWGICYLIGQQEVQCGNYTQLNNQYIVHYQNGSGSDAGKRFCTALTTEANSRFDKVCSSIGDFVGGHACMHGTCRVYEIK